MSVRDFRRFDGGGKKEMPPEFRGNIPIIGGGGPGAPQQRVLDAYGRELRVGDLVHLHTMQPQAFRVLSIKPVPPGITNAPALDVTFRAEARFFAPWDQRSAEFTRFLTAEEYAAEQAKLGVTSGTGESAKVDAPSGDVSDEAVGLGETPVSPPVPETE